jgi:flagellar basal body P-ring protein FlgI
LLLGGCSTWNALLMRSAETEEEQALGRKTRLVGDMAVPFGMFPVKAEAVGLVTGLQGTGGDPAPSPQRAALLAEMQTRGVNMPNRVLADDSTALVLVRGVLRPGIQKGDPFDLEVRIPSRSETTSLRGGWLMETRLRELAVLDNRIRDGHLLGLAQGPVLVDPSADPKEDRVLAARGRVLGGGVALKSRPLGLVLKPEHQNVLNASRISNAVNKRFHTFRHGLKTGVADAKTDEFVELTLHPRYKDNIQRYVQVVRAVAIRESATRRNERMQTLKRQLLDPITASDAAMQLEAIGRDGAEVLKAGTESDDPEVRFYAAEALAYLDDTAGVEPLAEAARNEPAFRVFALTALSAMNDFAAYESLRELLSSSSAETRYGAFRSLWAMNCDDALVRGEDLDAQFSYHVLDVEGPPMVHVTRSRRPEVVLFGKEQQFKLPLAVEAGTQIMVTSADSGEIHVSKYTVQEQDQKRIVSTSIDEVVRAVVELGGAYPDVVQMFQEAKASGALASRFEVDALPQAGRRYDRVRPEAEPPLDLSDLDVAEDGDATPPTAHSPLPELFDKADKKPTATGKGSVEGGDAPQGDGFSADDEKSPHTTKGFFARMMD